jgi:hypothetical protein
MTGRLARYRDMSATKAVTKAKAQHSEALVVLKNGKLVYESATARLGFER